jgi:hypothetical protein
MRRYAITMWSRSTRVGGRRRSSLAKLAAWTAWADKVNRSLRPSAILEAMDTDTNDLTAVWARVQAALPEGWQLDALRCASTGLAEADRSDDWIAGALGPDGQERQARAADPIAALEGLASSIG